VYHHDTIPFGEGDRMLLFTDGLIETRNRTGEEFGEGRVEGLLGVLASEPAERAADRLIEELYAWSGKSQSTSFDDDLTLIIVDFQGELVR